jgi:hypothetical protein
MNSKLFLSLLASVFLIHWGMALEDKHALGPWYNKDIRAEEEKIISDALKEDSNLVNICYSLSGKDREEGDTISNDDIKECFYIYGYGRISNMGKEGFKEDLKNRKMNLDQATVFLQQVLDNEKSMGDKCVMNNACIEILSFSQCSSTILDNSNKPLPNIAPLDACMELLDRSGLTKYSSQQQVKKTLELSTQHVKVSVSPVKKEKKKDKERALQQLQPDSVVSDQKASFFIGNQNNNNILHITNLNEGSTVIPSIVASGKHNRIYIKNTSGGQIFPGLEVSGSKNRVHLSSEIDQYEFNIYIPGSNNKLNVTAHPNPELLSEFMLTGNNKALEL